MCLIVCCTLAAPWFHLTCCNITLPLTNGACIWLQDYEPKFWYFEVLELLRKFLLTGIGIILAPDTIVQVVFNVIIVLAAAVVYLTARPYVNDSDDTVNTVAQWAMFIQLFAGLLLRTRMAVPDSIFSGGSFDSATLGQFIAVVMALVPCATLTTVVVSQWYSVWEQYYRRFGL